MKPYILVISALVLCAIILPHVSARGSKSGSSSSRSRTGSTGTGAGSKGSKKIGLTDPRRTATGLTDTGSTGSKTIGSTSTGNNMPSSGSIRRKPIGSSGAGFGIGVGVGTGLGSRLHRTRYNRRCTRNADCPTGRGFSGRCFGGSCQCYSWYTETDDGCVENNGRECKLSMDCDNSVIPLGGSGQCVNGYCTCMTGYAKTSEGCIAMADEVGLSDDSSVDNHNGLSCTSNLECDSSFIPFGGSGECQNGYCACLSGYKRTAHGCQAIMIGDGVSESRPENPSGSYFWGPGKPCSSYKDCPIDSAYNGACSTAGCVCAPFHRMERHRCISDSSTMLSGSLIVAMVTSVMGYLMML